MALTVARRLRQQAFLRAPLATPMAFLVMEGSFRSPTDAHVPTESGQGMLRRCSQRRCKGNDGLPHSQVSSMAKRERHLEATRHLSVLIPTSRNPRAGVPEP